MFIIFNQCIHLGGVGGVWEQKQKRLHHRSRLQFCNEASSGLSAVGGGGHYTCNRFFMGPFLVVKKIALS